MVDDLLGCLVGEGVVVFGFLADGGFFAVPSFYGDDVGGLSIEGCAAMGREVGANGGVFAFF